MSFSCMVVSTQLSFRSLARVLAGSLVWITSLVAAAEEKPITYEDHVAAILKKNCATCHGDAKQEGGLSLANYAGVMKGAGGGEIVIAGRSGGSRLI